MRRNYLIMIAAALTLAGCNSSKKSAPVQQAEEQKIVVKTSPAVEQTIAQNVEFTANIEPYKENYITPAIAGYRIDKILVDVGSKVRAGQLLVKMDPTSYNQQLVTLQNLEADYERTKAVHAAGGVSQQTLDQLETQLKVQRDAVANLKKNIELLSPINGVVTQRNSEEGDLFANTPVLQVMQIDKLKLKANISEQYFPNVKIGMPVEVRADVYPDKVFEGRVSLIHPALDAATRTFTVEVTVPNASLTLRPGMFARATFNMGDKQGVMIPDVAIMRQTGTNERYVYVISDGKAERRVVDLGRQVEGQVDILSGVEAGEQVAITGMSKMNNGSAVEVKNE